MTLPKAGKAGDKKQECTIAVRMIASPAPVSLWGLTPRHRIMRQLHQYDAVLSDTGPSQSEERALIVDEDGLYDQSVLDWLLDAPDRAIDTGSIRAAHIVSADGKSAAAWVKGAAKAPDKLAIASLSDIGQAHRKTLRKREDPWCLRLTQENRHKAEWRLFSASYKGVTDLVTKYVWPWPAFHVTRLCARLGISPNMVTSLSAILVILAFYLFWNGHFATGLLAAWGMTFLDTVDGKLARTTLQSSKWGNIFDHGIDLIHPPFWYWAWVHGLGTAIGAAEPLLMPALWIVVGGYIAGRLMEGYFIARYGIELHIWRRFDSFFRLIVARRNPNLILLSGGALIARPDWGFYWVAVWTMVGLIVHSIQILQAELAARRGTLSSWLSDRPNRGAA